MSAVHSVCVTLCYTCVAVGVISVLIPQKRTRRIMGFVIGLFYIGVLLTAVMTQLGSMDFSFEEFSSPEVPTFSEEEQQAVLAQQTADHLTQALDELLQNEGIFARDIRLTLKISPEGRITAARAVIYIGEEDRGRIEEIKSIIYRNISKEPEIIVTGEEAQRVAE